jgi:hypothetical protein
VIIANCKGALNDVLSNSPAVLYATYASLIFLFATNASPKAICANADFGSLATANFAAANAFETSGLVAFK